MKILTKVRLKFLVPDFQKSPFSKKKSENFEKGRTVNLKIRPFFSTNENHFASKVKYVYQ